MKDLKEKHVEYKNKISLNKFLEHHLKDATPEETKDSFKRMLPNLNLDLMP